MLDSLNDTGELLVKDHHTKHVGVFVVCFRPLAGCGLQQGEVRESGSDSE